METDGVPRVAVRSCITCSKAKAKCVRRVGESICERCARLKKECHSKEPVLKRRKPMKTSRAAQLEKLENKIEHLVNALSSTPQLPRPPTHEYGQPSPPISQISSTQFSTERAFGRGHEVLSQLCREPMHEAGETPGAQLSAARTPAVGGNAENKSTAVTLSEAEVLLDRYRRLMSTGMPFVILPPSTTATELYKSKPVLLRAVATVASIHDMARQQELVKELVRDVSERMLIKNEKSIDLLQAILVFVTWYHPHIFWSHQATNLLHLGIAMTIDMGIDRQPQQCGDFKSVTTKAVHGPNLATRMPTMEEHRALLGLFYLTSMLASSFKKVDAMPFTRYMEDCLSSLEYAREYDSDLFLVQLVRIQRIAETIHTTDCSTVPAKVYNKAFLADIERLRRADPCKEDNIFLQMQYLTAEILVFELSLSELQEDRSKPVSSVLDDLYRCVATIKTFLDVYFTIPPSSYLLLTFSIFGQFAHAFIVFTKLASLDVDGWDLKALNDQLNYLDFIEEAALRYEESTKVSPDGMALNNDAFGRWAVRIRWMKQVYESKFSSDGGDAIQGMQDPEKTSQPQEDLGQPTPPDDLLASDFFNYLDENFWHSFAGDYDIGFPEPIA